ncbi:hypothetical protein V1525DRAFT_439368 [Lipomyces kononenkoae]|uniref:Uncharacterized protein n=1 Tax=Lipomyces kononenkoae TaxID=34357 RepID=A0ACC3T5J8_LIPKO
MVDAVLSSAQTPVGSEQPTVESIAASDTSSKRKRTGDDPTPGDSSAQAIQEAKNGTKRPKLASDINSDGPASNSTSKISKREKPERLQARRSSKKSKLVTKNWRLTIKATEWSYLKLQIANVTYGTLIPSSTTIALPETIDLITIYTLLQSALKRYLGIVGSSLHFDILHVDNLTVFVRVPSRDFSPFWAAMSGYYVDTNAASEFKIVDGCSKVGITIAKTSKFLNGITGPPRKWVPPTSPITE